jgi:hypothetical protein
MGGERATDIERNAPHKNTFLLNPSVSNLWTETDSLHFARNGMAAAVLNNKIYVAGGSGGGMGGPPPRNNPDRPPQGQPENIPINKMSPPPNRPNGLEQNHPVDLEVFILK